MEAETQGGCLFVTDLSAGLGSVLSPCSPYTPRCQVRTCTETAEPGGEFQGGTLVQANEGQFPTGRHTGPGPLLQKRHWAVFTAAAHAFSVLFMQEP